MYKNYYISEGIEYEVSENPTSEELGEFQNRSYSQTENLISRTFDTDKDI